MGFGVILVGISCNHRPGNQDRNTTAGDDTVGAHSHVVSALEVLFPGEGEKLVKGETYTLKWEGGKKKVSIFLVDSSLESVGASVSISERVYEIVNTGAYEYKIPENLEEGKYKFVIGDGSSPYFEISSQ